MKHEFSWSCEYVFFIIILYFDSQCLKNTFHHIETKEKVKQRPETKNAATLWSEFKCSIEFVRELKILLPTLISVVNLWLSLTRSLCKHKTTSNRYLFPPFRHQPSFSNLKYCTAGLRISSVPQKQVLCDCKRAKTKRDFNVRARHWTTWGQSRLISGGMWFSCRQPTMKKLLRPSLFCCFVRSLIIRFGASVCCPAGSRRCVCVCLCACADVCVRV